MPEDPLVELDGVSVEFGDETALLEAVPETVKRRFGLGTEPVRAVDDVSLSVDEDDVVAVIGESGSGKTTLGKTAVALQDPTRGTVRYRGHEVEAIRSNAAPDGPEFADVRQALQIVHQDPGAALNPYRTVTSILSKPLERWHPELTRADREERIRSVLAEVGVTPVEEYVDRYPHELSGGEAQRITLLRAMLADPDLVLADEPVSALDPSLRVAIMDLMLSFKDAFDTSFLFVTHDVQHAAYMTRQVGGRIAVMYLGEIVEVGPAEEILDDPSHPYTKVLLWASLPGHPDDARRKLETDSPLRRADPPDLPGKPDGCGFHPRCPVARTACQAAAPDLERTGSNGRRSACFRADPDHDYWGSTPLGSTDTDGVFEDGAASGESEPLLDDAESSEVGDVVDAFQD